MFLPKTIRPMDGLMDSIIAKIPLPQTLTPVRAFACIQVAVATEALNQATSLDTYVANKGRDKIQVMMARVRRIVRIYVTRARTPETTRAQFVAVSSLVEAEIRARHPYVQYVVFGEDRTSESLSVEWAVQGEVDSIRLSAQDPVLEDKDWLPKDRWLSNTLVGQAFAESKESGQPYEEIHARLFAEAKKLQDEREWTDEELADLQELRRYAAKSYPDETPEELEATVLQLAKQAKDSGMSVLAFLDKDYEQHCALVEEWAFETKQTWYQLLMDRQWGI